MNHRRRIYAGLIVFVAIQAASIVVLSNAWSRLNNPGQAQLFAILLAYFAMLSVAGTVAGLIWPRAATRASQWPPADPPAASPSGIRPGPRTPAPLLARARREVGDEE